MPDQITDIGAIPDDWWIGGYPPSEIERFCAVALRHRISSGIAPFNRKLFAEIDNPALVVLIPRRHGKSTTFSCISPTYKGLFRPGWQYLIISQTAALSEFWIREISRELKTNKWILDRFGDQEGDKWTSTELHLKNGSKIGGAGMGFQVRGFGWNEVVIDDPQSDDQVKSEAVLKDHIDIFDKGIINTMEPGALIKFVGTPINEACLLMDVINKRDGKYKAFEKIWFPVMSQELLDWAWAKFLNGESVDERNDEVLFPQRWSLKQMMEKRSMIGSFAFDSEYMLSPRNAEDFQLLPSWIRYYRELLTCRYHKVLAIDPALSEKETASLSALCHVWLALDGAKKGQHFVPKNEGRRLSPDALGNWIIDEYIKFRPHEIIIEDVAFQRVLETVLKLKAQERLLHLPIRLVKPDKDKIRRLQDVSYLFENGHVEFAPSLREFVENELLRFPNGPKDRVDALVYGLKATSEYSVKGISNQDIVRWQAMRKKNMKYDPVVGKSALVVR